MQLAWRKIQLEVGGHPLQAEKPHATHTRTVLPWVTPFLCPKEATYVKERSPGEGALREVTRQIGSWVSPPEQGGRFHIPLAQTHIISDDLRQ